MTLRFPKEGSGPGSCYFKPGLDLDVLEASTSDIVDLKDVHFLLKTIPKHFSLT